MTAVCVLNQNNTFQCLPEQRSRAGKMEIHSEAFKHTHCKLLDHIKPKSLQEMLEPPQKAVLKPNASSWF